MAMTAGAVLDRVSTVGYHIDVGAVLDEKSHDTRVAVARGVVNRLITTPIGRGRKLWMPVEQ